MPRKKYRVIYLGGPLNNKLAEINVLQRTFVYIKTATPRSPAGFTATYKLLDSPRNPLVLYRYRFVEGK